MEEALLDEGAEAPLAGPGPAGPYVLQCKRCRTIVGDSTLVRYRHGGAHALALRGCASVERVARARASDECDLLCVQCNASLGCITQRVASQLRCLAGLLVLCSDVLQSHMLGFCSLVAPSASGDSERDVDAATLDAASRQQPPDTRNESVAIHSSSELEQRVEQLEQQLVKAENMILLHQERLDSLEQGAAPSTARALPQA